MTDPARRIVPYCAILFIMDERLCQQIWPRTMPRKAVAHTSKSISSPKSIRDVCRKMLRVTCCVSMSRVSPGHVSETSAPGRDRVLSGLGTIEPSHGTCVRSRTINSLLNMAISPVFGPFETTDSQATDAFL